MKSRLPLATALGAFTLSVFATTASAETLTQPLGVVELFTSQGCSSSPQANESVSALHRANPDILTLSYGVTYWDYLGWKDTFGHAEFTQRQRQYDAALQSGVYTPMLVVGGRNHAPRLSSDAMRVAVIPDQLRFTRQSGELCLSGDLPEGTTLAVIDYVPGIQSVMVERGENKGRQLSVSNVVTHVEYRAWTDAMICGFYPTAALAVLAHDPDTRAVIGAARYEP